MSPCSSSSRFGCSCPARYINSRVVGPDDEDEASGRRVVLRTLPRDAPVLHLVQLQLKEEHFVRKSKALDRALTHKDVEGV